MKTVQYISLFVAIAIACTGCNRDKTDYDATGTFEATEILVSSEVTGKIMELNLQEGDRITAGQQVGYIDSMQTHYQKLQLAAGLRAVDVQKPDIRKQIAALEQQIATARSEQQRMENLVRANAGNQKQVDDIVNNIAYLQKELAAQYSTLNKSTAGSDAEADRIVYQIMQLDDQIQKCRIINPQTGTILVKYAEPSEITTAGKPLYKIADTGLLYLRAYITADLLTRMKMGQQVQVFADFGTKEQRQYTGTVTWVSDKSEFTPKGIQTKDERANLVYAVKIAVQNDGYLKIGQYGEVKL